jgi:Amidohydrolase family
VCIVCGPDGNRFLQSIGARYGASGIRSPSRFTAEEIAPPVAPPLDPTDQTDLVGPADVILRGGSILTMQRGADVAEAVALRAGRIQRIGDEDSVRDLRGRLTRTVDLDGQTLMPGFIIADWHPPISLLCDWLDADQTSERALDAALAERSNEWLALRIGDCADDQAKATIVAGSSRPAVAVDRTGAILEASAAAATLAPALNLTRNQETASQTRPHVSALVPNFLERLAVSRESLGARLSVLFREAARRGVTTLRLCGLDALAGPDDANLVRSAAGESPLLRLRGAVDGRLALQVGVARLPVGFGDDMFRVDTATLWIDEDDDDAHELAETLAALRSLGWRVTLHAASLAAVELACESLTAAVRSGARFDASDGVELRAAPPAETWALIQQLGVSVGFTLNGPPENPVDLGWPTNVPVSLAGDLMAGPPEPLRMLSKMNWFGRFSRAEGLSSITLAAATRCGARTILGSLEVGKYADLVFVNSDPRQIDAHGPPKIHCLKTWIAGHEVRA